MKFSSAVDLYDEIVSHPLVHGVGLVSIGNVLNYVLGGMYWFLMAYLLIPNDFGLLNLYFSIATYGSTFALFGLNYSLINNYSKEDHNQIVYEIFILTLILSAVVSFLIFCLFWDSIPHFNLVIIDLFLISVTISTILMAMWIAKLEYKTFIIMILSLRLLRIIFSLTFYYLYHELIYVLIGFIFGTIPLFILFFKEILQSSITKVYFPPFTVKYALMFIYSLLNTSMLYLDKIIIWLLYGEYILGLYQFAFQFFIILNIIPISLFHVMLSQHYTENSNENISIKLILSVIIIIIFSFDLIAWLIIPIIFPQYLPSRILLIILNLSIFPSLLSSWYSSKIIKNDNYFLAIKMNIIGITFIISSLYLNKFIINSFFLLGAIPLFAYFFQVLFIYLRYRRSNFSF